MKNNLQSRQIVNILMQETVRKIVCEITVIVLKSPLLVNMV